MTIIQELEVKYKNLCEKLGDKYSLMELLQEDVKTLHEDIKQCRADYAAACAPKEAPCEK